MAVGDILREFSVPNQATGNARGLACDGTYLYMTIVESKNIFKLDLNGNYVATIPTTNIYGGLYYDKKENVLWAGNYNYNGYTDDGTYEIYKLKLDGTILQTINYKNIVPANLLSQATFPSKVCGITIDSETGTIFFSPTLSRYVFNITKNGEYIGYFDGNVGEQIVGVTTYCENLWLSIPQVNPTEIREYTSTGEYLESVVPAPFPIYGSNADLEYDTKTFAPKCVVWAITATWETPVIRAIEVKCCKSAREQSITDLITSVSLEQTALSHILNAEGEKLQKAFGFDLNQGELLEMNASVNQMVDSISNLEMVLLSKLKVFPTNLCDVKSNGANNTLRSSSYIEYDLENIPKTDGDSPYIEKPTE